MRERKILGNDLLDSIFVRVYEKRINLLKAVIIGAQGTPYHNALFFFDIAFLYNYPVKPPQVFYMSYGPRLNPNLYPFGLVNLFEPLEHLGWQRKREMEPCCVHDSSGQLGLGKVTTKRNEASLQNGLKKLDNDETKKKIGDNILKKKNLDLFHRVLGRLELCLGLNNDNTVKSKELKI
ncbi:hypothetical protein Q3G72_022902 [Acer saccharum]|nr:hypothetical protein Q3G72_022902 [Acer saccharum]